MVWETNHPPNVTGQHLRMLKSTQACSAIADKEFYLVKVSSRGKLGSPCGGLGSPSGSRMLFIHIVVPSVLDVSNDRLNRFPA